jgi:hypothetical protein
MPHTCVELHRLNNPGKQLLQLGRSEDWMRQYRANRCRTKSRQIVRESPTVGGTITTVAERLAGLVNFERKSLRGWHMLKEDGDHPSAKTREGLAE